MQRLLPYAFNGLDYLYNPTLAHYYNLIPAYFTSRLDDQFLQNTSLAYTSLLQAIAEQDKEYLKTILEPKLYHATSHCMDVLQEQQIKLQYIEEQNEAETEEHVDQEESKKQNQKFGMFTTLFNPNAPKKGIYHIYNEKNYKCNLDVRGVFGVKINRADNGNTKFLQLPKLQITPRTYYVNFSNPKHLFENQIMVVNVLIQTNKKLIGLDQEGKVQYGNSDLQEQTYHKLRLESYVPNYNWVITDIDDYLKGNPYF